MLPLTALIAVFTVFTLPALSAWTNFYVIIGSSAGALTGLTFVVVTLMPRRRLEGAS